MGSDIHPRPKTWSTIGGCPETSHSYITTTRWLRERGRRKVGVEGKLWITICLIDENVNYTIVELHHFCLFYVIVVKNFLGNLEVTLFKIPPESRTIIVCLSISFKRNARNKNYIRYMAWMDITYFSTNVIFYRYMFSVNRFLNVTQTCYLLKKT